jgi:hypothetical protein
MDYRKYADWCDENNLPAMDYLDYEAGWINRGMESEDIGYEAEETGQLRSEQ